jgi:Methylase of polypeptide chain release factors
MSARDPGCIAVAIARLRPRVRVIASDLSTPSLDVARRMPPAMQYPSVSHGWKAICWGRWRSRAGRTHRRHRLEPSLYCEADWAFLQPEVRLFEPRGALVAGPQGTELHERLLQEAGRYLIPGGALIMEIGAGQARTMRRIVDQISGYRFHRLVYDAAGLERVVIVERVGT